MTAIENEVDLSDIGISIALNPDKGLALFVDRRQRYTLVQVEGQFLFSVVSGVAFLVFILSLLHFSLSIRRQAFRVWLH